MAKSFEKKLRDHARLALVGGLSLDQRPRPLMIDADVDPHVAELVAVIAEEAHKYGAGIVDVKYTDARVRRSQFMYAPEDLRLRVSQHDFRRYEEAVEIDAAFLGITCRADAGVYAGVDPKYPVRWRSAVLKSGGKFTDRRIAGLQPWNLIPCPSEAWAKSLGMSVQDLWEVVFRITGADLEDPLGYMRTMTDRLRTRANQLDSLAIQTLIFEGPHMHLSVGLSEESAWQGGPKSLEDGTRFVANWPTFENFTTPDWRTVEGHLRTTKPVAVGGTLVTDLELQIHKGRIDLDSVKAKTGRDAYLSLISTDEGAAQVGEVAVVGIDTPIAESGRFFEMTLLDENCACHIATGRAYPSALKNGKYASAAQLADWGCNSSETHTDIMISDAETTVTAIGRDRKIVLIEKGLWTPEFS